MHLPPESRSLWIATTPATSYPALPADLEADVAIVGGGLTGLVAAWLLTDAGRRVVVLEQGHIADGETGNTTAHVTALVDTRYPVIERDFGREGARLVARSSQEAIDWIEETARALRIDCAFERVPGYLYTERREDRGLLTRELDAADRAGLPVTLASDVPLPFPTAGAIRIDQQAQFHPRAFLLPLAERIVSRGGRIFEETRMTAVRDGEPCEVETSNGTVRAQPAGSRARSAAYLRPIPVTSRSCTMARVTPAFRTFMAPSRGTGRAGAGELARAGSLRPAEAVPSR